MIIWHKKFSKKVKIKKIKMCPGRVSELKKLQLCREICKTGHQVGDVCKHSGNVSLTSHTHYQTFTHTSHTHYYTFTHTSHTHYYTFTLAHLQITHSLLISLTQL